MKVLISGATGFLGRVLMKELVNSWEVHAIARTIPIWASDYPQVSWIEGDFVSGIENLALPDKIDTVCHLAQSPHYRDFPNQANHIFQVNVASTQYLLDYAAKAGAKNFLFTSTGSVYEPYDSPLFESAPLAPVSYYSASKLAAESLARGYMSLMSVCMIRLFFLYGPGQENKLIPDLIERVKNGKPITLVGHEDGMTITPTFVADAAKACTVALTEGWEGVINLASPTSVSLKELSEVIGHAVGRTPLFQGTEGSSVRIVPDTSRLQILFSPTNFTPLSDGLRLTLAANQS